MAEKWDDGTNDSPEVVYEGFNPTPTPAAPQTHPGNTPTPPQPLAPPPPPPQAFVGDGRDGTVPMGGTGPPTFLTEPQGNALQQPPQPPPPLQPLHHQPQQHQDNEDSGVVATGGAAGVGGGVAAGIAGGGGGGGMPAGGPADRGRLCFVCCGSVSDKTFESVRSSMNHSHAPLLVLLTDVLGYKLEAGRLHSEVVCKTCYHLLDIIDELQQTLTESKTDVRTKFLETIQRLRLKYPRTDKMLKPRCLRCIQMSQSSARRRGRGSKGWKGRVDDQRGRGKAGRGRGSGRGAGRTEDGQDLGSDNDLESVMIMEVEPDIDVDDDNGGGSSGGGGGQQQHHHHHHQNQPQHHQQQQQQQQRPSTTTANTTTNNTNTKPPPPQQQPPQPSPNIVFDTDPAFFSPDEKLKVGVIREENGTQVFLCMYCRIRCESALALKMHVRVYHMPVLVYDNGLGTAETRYRMGIKLQNTSCTELTTSEKPFACLFCESSYKLQSSLQSHFREHHSPNKPFQCLECKEGFRRPIELSRHRLYRCPVQKMT